MFKGATGLEAKTSAAFLRLYSLEKQFWRADDAPIELTEILEPVVQRRPVRGSISVGEQSAIKLKDVGIYLKVRDGSPFLLNVQHGVGEKKKTMEPCPEGRTADQRIRTA